MKRGRRRKLSEEELLLWRSVVRDADPLHPDSASVSDPDSPPEKRSAPAPPPPDLETKSVFPRSLRPVGRPPETLTRFQPDTPPIAPLTKNTPGLDRRTAEKLRKGERAPEARLDLHGMTLERAHRALLIFLEDSRARGLRCVLVITGKGGDYKNRAIGSESGSGAIRSEAPRWLREPVFARHVTGVYEAHRKHGGAGALYVYLRKAK